MKFLTSMQVFGGLLAVSSAALAQDAELLASNAAACSAVAHLSAPIGDQPTEDEQFRLGNCVAEDLYYGIGRAADLREARLCAFVEIALKNTSALGSQSVLMLMYANGEGVKRNLPLARKYACEMDGSSQELGARLKRIAAMEKAGAKAARLDVCADASFDVTVRGCAIHDAKLSLQAREARWTSLQRQWPAADIAALDALRARAKAFFESRIQNEVDLRDSMRTSIAISERETLESQLIDSISKFERGDFPKLSAADSAAAISAREQRLEQARAAAAATGGEQQFGPLGTIRPEGIRSTARVWARYRDAWIAFAAVRYPKVSAEVWNGWLAGEREQQLRRMIEKK